MFRVQLLDAMQHVQNMDTDENSQPLLVERLVGSQQGSPRVCFSRGPAGLPTSKHLLDRGDTEGRRPTRGRGATQAASRTISRRSLEQNP